ncbi:hypothetical protein Pelo_11940 [Pelomyxa schiedti]|nr:hypothetical protein Pelo_11940 [Pelomyxa schiedti]
MMTTVRKQAAKRVMAPPDVVPSNRDAFLPPPQQPFLDFDATIGSHVSPAFITDEPMPNSTMENPLEILKAKDDEIAALNTTLSFRLQELRTLQEAQEKEAQDVAKMREENFLLHSIVDQLDKKMKQMDDAKSNSSVEVTDALVQKDSDPTVVKAPEAVEPFMCKNESCLRLAALLAHKDKELKNLMLAKNDMPAHDSDSEQLKKDLSECKDQNSKLAELSQAALMKAEELQREKDRSDLEIKQEKEKILELEGKCCEMKTRLDDLTVTNTTNTQLREQYDTLVNAVYNVVRQQCNLQIEATNSGISINEALTQVENIALCFQQTKDSLVSCQSKMSEHSTSLTEMHENERQALLQKLNDLTEQLNCERTLVSGHTTRLRESEAKNIELESQMDSLQRQIQTHHEAEKLHTTLKMDNSTLSTLLQTTREEVASVQRELTQKTAVVEEQQKEIQHLVEEAEKATLQLAAVEQIKAELEADIQSTQQEKKNLEKEKLLLQTELGGNAKLKLEISELADIKQQHQECQYELERMKKSLTDERLHNEQLQKELEGATVKVTELQDTQNQLQSFQQQNATLKEELTSTKQHSESQCSTISLLKEEINNLKTSITSLQQQCEGLILGAQDLQGQNQKLQESITLLQEQKESLLSQLSTLTAQYTQETFEYKERLRAIQEQGEKVVSELKSQSDMQQRHCEKIKSKLHLFKQKCADSELQCTKYSKLQSEYEILLPQHANLQAKHSQLSKTCETLESEKAQLKEENTTIANKLRTQQEYSDKKLLELSQHLKALEENKNKELCDLLQQLKESQERYQMQVSEVERLKQSLANDELKHASLVKMMDEQREQSISLLHSMEDQCAELKKENADMEKRFHKERQEFEQQHQALHQKCTQQQQSNCDLQLFIGNMTAENEKQRKQFSQEIEQQHQTIVSQSSQLTVLLSQVEEGKVKAEELSHQCNNYRQESGFMQSEFTTLKERYNQAQEKLTSLEEKNLALQESNTILHSQLAQMSKNCATEEQSKLFADLLQQTSELKDTVGKYMDQLACAKQKNVELERTISDYEKRELERKQEIDLRNEEKIKISRENTTLLDTIKEKETLFEKQKLQWMERLENYQADANSMQELSTQQQSKIQNMEAQIRSYESQQIQLLQENTALTLGLSQATQVNNEKNKQLELQDQMYRDLENKSSNAAAVYQKQIGDLQKYLEEQRLCESTLEKEIAQQRDEISKLQGNLVALETLQKQTSILEEERVSLIGLLEQEKVRNKNLERRIVVSSENEQALQSRVDKMVLEVHSLKLDIEAKIETTVILQDQVEKLKAKKCELKKLVTERKKALSCMEQRVSGLSEVNATQMNTSLLLQQQLHDTNEKLDTSVSRTASLVENIHELEIKLNHVRSAEAVATENLVKYERANESIHSSLETTNAEKATLQKRADELEKSLALSSHQKLQLQTKIESLTRNIDLLITTHESELTPVKSQLEEKTAQLQVAMSELNSLEDKVTHMGSELKEKEMQLSMQKTELGEVEARCHLLQSKNQEFEERLVTADNLCKESAANLQIVKQNLNDTEARTLTLLQHNKELQDQLTILDSRYEEEKSLKAITENKYSEQLAINTLMKSQIQQEFHTAIKIGVGIESSSSHSVLAPGNDIEVLVATVREIKNDNSKLRRSNEELKATIAEMEVNMQSEKQASADKMTQLLSLQQTLEQTKTELCQHIANLETRISHLATKLQEKENEIKESKALHEKESYDMQCQVDTLTTKCKDYNTCKEQLTQTIEQLTFFQSMADVLQTKLKQMEVQLGQTRDSLNSERLSKESAQEQLVSVNENLCISQEELLAVKKQLEENRNCMEEEKRKCEALEKHLKQAQARLAQLTESSKLELNAKNTLLRETTNDLQCVKERLTMIEKELISSEKTKGLLESKLSAQQLELTQYQAELTQYQANLAAAKQREGANLSSTEDLKAHQAHLEIQISDILRQKESAEKDLKLLTCNHTSCLEKLENLEKKYRNSTEKNLALEDNGSRLEDRISELETALEQSNSQIQLLTEQVARKNQEAEEWQNQNSSLIHEKESLSSMLGSVKSGFEEKECECRRLEVKIANYENQKNEAAEQLHKIKSAIITKEKELGDLLQRLQAESANNSSLINARQREELKVAAETSLSLRKQLTICQRAEEELNSLRENNASLDQRLSEATELTALLQNEINESDKRVDSQKKELESAHNKLLSLTTGLTEAVEERNGLSERVTQLEKELAQISSNSCPKTKLVLMEGELQDTKAQCQQLNSTFDIFRCAKEKEFRILLSKYMKTFSDKMAYQKSLTILERRIQNSTDLQALKLTLAKKPATITTANTPNTPAKLPLSPHATLPTSPHTAAASTTPSHTTTTSATTPSTPVHLHPSLLHRLRPRPEALPPKTPEYNQPNPKRPRQIQLQQNKD